MDDFRKLQKIDCANGGKKNLKYGCPCCRSIADPRKFKKVSHKMARRRLRQADYYLI